MSVKSEIHACCRNCGGRHDAEVYSSIDVSAEPELKERILSGDLFIWKCPACDTVNLARYPLLYHDPSEHLVLLMTDANVNADGLPEGYCGRIVHTPGELIEKIKIFDAGLDDVVVEMCKWVTVREMGKDADLRFLRLEGADSEMIFTYPEGGQMQMLSVGSNVYEDCRAIVARNPSLLEESSRLACIDYGWLCGKLE